MSDGLPSLPGVLAEIEEIAGREAALVLAGRFGGQSVHVPKSENLGVDHPLLDAVGEGVAAIIADRFNGEHLYIPMARRAEVHALHAAGFSKAEIATRLRISRRSVERYLHTTPVA